MKVLTQGGLGNQLFQLAFGLANRTPNEDISIVVFHDDVANINKSQELSEVLRESGVKTNFIKLPIIMRKCMNFLLRECANSRFRSPIIILMKLITSKFLSLSGIAGNIAIGQGLGYFEWKPALSKGESLAIGYFQSYRWPTLAKAEIERVLSFSPATDYNRSKRRMLVHVRRGDYKSEGFGLLGKAYYREGIDLVRKITGAQEILLFSDEYQVAEALVSEVSDLPIICGEEPSDTPIQILKKMSDADGFVIANSSLSWWAAFLSRKPSAPIVAPKKWFHNQEDPLQLIPENWIRIESSFIEEVFDGVGSKKTS